MKRFVLVFMLAITVLGAQSEHPTLPRAPIKPVPTIERGRYDTTLEFFAKRYCTDTVRVQNKYDFEVCMRTYYAGVNFEIGWITGVVPVMQKQVPVMQKQPTK